MLFATRPGETAIRRLLARGRDAATTYTEVGATRGMRGGEQRRFAGRYALDHHSIVWDDGRMELVLFGGKNYRYVLNGRTRSLSTQVWEERSREGPSGRHSAPLIWHATRATVMLFGGKHYEGEEQLPLGDLWEWDGQKWRPLD